MTLDFREGARIIGVDLYGHFTLDEDGESAVAEVSTRANFGSHSEDSRGIIAAASQSIEVGAAGQSVSGFSKVVMFPKGMYMALDRDEKVFINVFTSQAITVEVNAIVYYVDTD